MIERLVTPARDEDVRDRAGLLIDAVESGAGSREGPINHSMICSLSSDCRTR